VKEKLSLGSFKNLFCVSNGLPQLCLGLVLDHHWDSCKINCKIHNMHVSFTNPCINVKINYNFQNEKINCGTPNSKHKLCAMVVHHITLYCQSLLTMLLEKINWMWFILPWIYFPIQYCMCQCNLHMCLTSFVNF
jgi:hypothetical protein